MPFALPVGHKFACIALANAGVARELREQLDFGDGLWALLGPPFELDDTWHKWLGSIQAETLTRSNLVLLAHRASERPEILDGENAALRQDSLSLFYALFLKEVFHFDGGLVLSGANVGGEVGVRQVSHLEQHYRPAQVHPAQITRACLLQSARVAAGLRTVHTPGARNDRLRRGFHAWIRGIQEYYGDERLHQFVRTVETVVKPARGKSRRQFVHRCQLFAGTSKKSANLLGELYDLRSWAEHLHSLDQGLARYRRSVREGIALRRAYQAQLLASNVYERIFADDNLRVLFATDADIEGFWRRSRNQQVQTWGDPIDLETLCAARFIR